MTLILENQDRARLAGGEGPAMQLAMRLIVQAAAIMGAERLIPIGFAHIDSCFYAGEAHVDFARFLLDHDARFAIPIWTNNGVVSLADPGLRPEVLTPGIVRGARELMHLYERMGCKPVWTCAPYQLPGRPVFGDHIVAGESNAVSFYNSVIGARTNKYGDYLDVACALIGKAPYAGLHTDAARRAALAFRLDRIPDTFRREDIFYHLLGHYAGRASGRRVPVIDGLPRLRGEDHLKAMSAAVAASGGVELWHGVGVTPEAPSLDAIFDGGDVQDITMDHLRAARDELTTARDGPLDMVALGTPHFSPTEFDALLTLLDGRTISKGLHLTISTSRFVRDYVAAKGWIERLERAGAAIIVDTCTYFSPAVRNCRGRVMTNAAKWAYYAPGMIGVEVCFGSLRECVESAVKGETWRDPHLWVET
ncbi:aconitase X catalytic domain-containing protein [soil metagenome]